MKERLDTALVRRGFFSGRDRAAMHVKQGLVLVNGAYADKPGMRVEEEDVLEVQQNLIPFVSRGGLKLEHAISAFQVGVKDKICMDVGASTGGFTQVLLTHGAASVVAVDTGRDQLSPVLRENDRVVCMERTDVRNLPSTFDGRFDLVTVDVSFISLSLILPRCARLLKPHGRLICLLKPQFEVGREHIGKKGIVRDERVHRELLERTLRDWSQGPLYVQKGCASPIRGGDGNVEYLFLLSGEAPGEPPDPRVLIEEGFRPAAKGEERDTL